MMNLSKILGGCCCIIALAALNGCSASRALNKESPKNYSVLKKGTDRDLVRAELGTPQISTGGDKCDVFSFVEGSGGAKYLRAVGYSILAVGTLGISETITNPAEAAVGNDKIRLRVCYDEDNNVNKLERLEVGKPAVLLDDPEKI